jgi:predicted ATP-dependent protease
VIAGRADRLTARFSEIVGILREAAHWAARRGGAAIEQGDIAEALGRRRRRDGALEERIQELLLEGTLLVETNGTAVGQVNALSVYDLGYTMFGKPTRITASASPGRGGIVNVEREARLSGGIYDKGVMIIGGYLRRRHAGSGPLPLTASLTFEQSYAGVDGDSASIAEVVALVSELSGIPVDNRIAVTGSINQHGEVQPVGGVNEKIRGWYELCAARDGDEHAVLLPATNVRDLMLDREIVEAVRGGRFRVYAVRHVDEAIEIALGLPVSEIDEAVRTRLKEFADALRDEPDVAPASEADGRRAEPAPTPPGA